ncbi:predicted protein [Arabidopsis lyrata subsp. lyrata]|uniref:Predicted protein n=1 Tax=Arabidopsis lyrata subsp. lyrata TaxID=81972 RepID=D7M7K1_ARALL|nr:predicted protein [Arabidopsis lyrata subsp. lyrata]
MVGVQPQEASGKFWTSMVPRASQIRRQRRNQVNRGYNKAQKQRMKPKHHSQSSHLSFQLRSSRNQLYLGDDRVDSMAVLWQERSNTQELEELVSTNVSTNFRNEEIGIDIELW